MPRFGPPDALARLATSGVHVDSVEFKALLEPPAGPVAEALTGRAAPTWSERRAYLLDTTDLDLVRAGVEIRLRLRARGRYDLAVSAHHTGAESPATPRGVRVELDVVPGAVWQDAEMRRDIDAAAAETAITGRLAAGSLLSTPQRRWACTGGTSPVDPACLQQLRVHGPLVVQRVKVAAARGLKRADLEHFVFPSGRELMELSTHCGPKEVEATAAAFERLLEERALRVAPGYCTKTEIWWKEVLRDGGVP